MDITELNELESSVQDLISAAKVELEAKRLEKQRDEYYQHALAEIEARLNAVLAQVQTTLKELPADEFGDSITRRKLQEKEADILQQLADAPRLASEAADRQLILQEERLIEERLLDQTNRWRYELREDLLDMIRDQQDFYSATDAAVAIRGYMHDLKAIDALTEALEAFQTLKSMLPGLCQTESARLYPVAGDFLRVVTLTLMAWAIHRLESASGANFRPSRCSRSSRKASTGLRAPSAAICGTGGRRTG